MTDHNQILSTLETALVCGETSVIVRSSGAIAEVHGLLTVRRGIDWITLGEEGRTHVHLKIGEGCRLHYRHVRDTHAALELAQADGEVLCRVVFRGTNPAKAETYDPTRAALAQERFGHLANECATT